MTSNGRQFLYMPLEIPVNATSDDGGDQFSRKLSGSGSPSKMPLSSPKVNANANTEPYSPTIGGKGRLQNSPQKSAIDAINESLSATDKDITGILKQADLADILPEEIQTSLYIQQANADFQIIIRPPCLEYTIPSKNFMFIKTLTREENQEFITSNFADWQIRAIRQLSRHNKFTELLALVAKGADYKLHCAKLERE